MKMRWDTMLYVVAMLSLVLMVVHAGRGWLEFVAGGPVGAEGALGYVNASLIGLVHILPFLLLMPGLAAVLRLSAQYRLGTVFSHGNAKLIEQFGGALVWSAAALVVLRPTLLDWIYGVDNGIEVQLGEASIALFSAGVFVFTMARVMAEAVALKEDSDSIV